MFMIGGTTYEEAKVVAQINASTPGVRVVLGGTTVLNSELFFEDVNAAVSSWGLLDDVGGGTVEGRLRREIAGGGGGGGRDRRS